MNNFKDEIKNNLKNLIKLYIFALLFLSIWRLFFLFYYGETESIKTDINNLIDIFILGFRIDLSLIGYIQIPISIYIILNIFRETSCNKKILTIYLSISFLIYSFFLFADFGFYSFFGEHINLIFFGIIDDDRIAILKTILDNYPITLIFLIANIYIFLVYKYINMNMK